MRLLLLLPLLAPAAIADVRVVAFSGEPFGVAEITFSGSDVPYDSNRYTSDATYASVYEQLQALGHSAFYPVSSQQMVEGDSVSWTVRFLFREIDVFEVETRWRYKEPGLVIRPVVNPEKHRSLLLAWHRDYGAQAMHPANKRRYPTVVDTYLLSMLTRRLELPAHSVPKNTQFGSADMDEFIGLMTGTEAIRLAMQRDVLLQTKAETQPASLPLPEPITPPAVEIPKVDANTKVEPLSLVVPHECFYARFGSFKSFMWFRNRVDQWGSELRNLTSVRGLDYGLTEKLQTQLALPDSEISRLLGPTAVSDVAIIGQDTFIREGAAVGVVFEAANNVVLSASLNAHRQAVAKEDESIVLEEQKLDGFPKAVSFLHSKDNRIRSFYARYEKFHLVTTSRNIARRFLECAMQKKNSLGASDEFLHARTVMPLANDSIFFYLSDAFIRTFVEPHYRIEMTRRARSESEIELVHVAQLAAKSEGKPHETMKDLIDGQFLPIGFDKRADGSRLILSEGEWVDSLRGRRGSFLPIPDTPVEHATQKEIDAYAQFGRRYRRIWRGMDPAMVSIRRVSNGKTERLKFHLHVFPIPSGDFWWLGFLQSSENAKTLTGTKGIPVVAEAYWGGQPIPIVAGLFDAPIPFVIRHGEIDAEFDHGGWFAGNFASSREGNGIHESMGPLSGQPGWAFESDDLNIFSRSKRHLEQFGPKLGLRESNRTAKFRLRIEDLSKTRLSTILNAGGWVEAQKVTAGNIKWLNRLMSQLHVPGPNCRAASRRILNARLSNPLDGEYGTAKARLSYSANDTPRPEFVLPLLKWFSKGTLELNSTRDTLTSHGEVWLRGLEDSNQ